MDQEVFSLIKEANDSEFSVEIFYTIIEDLKRELISCTRESNDGDLDGSFNEKIKNIINSVIDEWEEK